MDVLKHILFLLNVKFTYRYLCKIYMENPNNTNLLGFSNILRLYGVDTQAGKIANKETFGNEILPFLTRLDDVFVVVEETKDNGYKLYSDKYTYIEKSTFLKKWDGTFLAFEKTKQSCEPQYENNKKEDRQQRFYAIMSCCSLLLLCLLTILLKRKVVLNSVNVLGCGFGLFLTYCIMSLHAGKNMSKKLCTSNSHFDCNIVYKFGGIIDMADMSVAYFGTFLLLTIFFKLSTLFLTLFWVSAIPVVAWSLWLQFFSVKKICPLCLCLQATILVLSIFNACTLDFNNVHLSKLDLENALYCTLLYITFFAFSAKYSKKILSSQRQIEEIRKSNNFLKEQYLLMLSNFSVNSDFETEFLDSFNWGKPNAQKELVAILNPTCKPCALDFLNMYNAMSLNNSIKVHVYFTYWTKEQHEKLKILVSAILQNPSKAMFVIHAWYDFGVYNTKLFLQKISTKETGNKSIDSLIDRQKEWCLKNNIHSTPSFILNGQFLPKGFNFMDIINF